MRLLLLGSIASGKGTLGEKISNYYNIPLLSVGNLLRSLKDTNKLQKAVFEQMKGGKLVQNNLVAELLKNEILKDKYKKGYILDGWGRQKSDLDLFNPGFNFAVYINIPSEVSIQRLVTRRTCSKCGEVYNIVSHPPKKANMCDICGGKLYQRDDDKEDAIVERMRIFKEKTLEVIADFRKNGILLEIDGNQPPDQVFSSFLKLSNDTDKKL